MKRRVVVMLALWPLFFSCKKTPDLVFPELPVPRVVESPPVATTPLPRPTVPSDLDLYTQFTHALPGSATQRLREIVVLKDSILVASSVFSYNEAGQLASRRYLRYVSGWSPDVYTLLYTYDGQGQLTQEATSRTIDQYYTERVVQTIDYSYAANQLAVATQKTPAYTSASPLTLNARTMYRYPEQHVGEAVRLGYYSVVGTVNVSAPMDSTRQRTVTTDQLTMRTDSVWTIDRPYGSAIQAKLSRRLSQEITRDAQGNALSIRKTTTNYWSNGNMTTTANSDFAHVYDGLNGLLSRSEFPAMGLSYRFIYESK